MDNLYKGIIFNSSIGYAYHRLIYDEKNIACDYIFLEANKAFGELTGLNPDNIIDKKITKIIPNIKDDSFDWIGFYSSIVKNNLNEVFTQYSSPLGKYYRVNVFSPAKDHFVTMISFPSSTEMDFKNLFENMPIGGGIYKVTNDGSKSTDYIGVDFNKQSCLMENKKREDMIGKTSHDLRPNLDEFGLIDVFKQVWETGKSQNFPTKKYSDDNFDNYYDIDVFKLSEDSIVAMYKDVTEHILEQQELKENKDKLQTYLDNAPFGIFIADELGNYVEVNIKAYEMTGYSKEELIGKNILDITDDSYKEISRHAFSELITKGFADEEILSIRKNGEKRLWNIRASKINDKRYLGFATDITEEKNRESMIHQFEDILNLEFMGYVFLDLDRKIIHVNDYFANVHGWSADKAIGKKVDIFHTKEQMPSILNAFSMLIDSELIKSIELMHWDKKNKREFPMLMSSVVMKDKNGNPQHIASLALDISNYKELEDKNTQMQMMLKNQQKLESIGTLASGVAHEINNPINGIMNYSQLILDATEEDSENHIFANEIINETKRVTGIVNSLLQFSRHGRASYSNVYMSNIINSCIVLIETLIKRRLIDFTVDISKNLPRISCKSQQIQQVLLNLITNSADSLDEKYGKEPDEKKITLSAKLIKKNSKSYIQIAVKDNGMGISGDIQDQIFDPFFTTKPRDKGTGLGLAISYGIINEHNGEIYFKSKKGKSTVFYVDLPVSID